MNVDMDTEPAYMTFSFTDVDGTTTTKSVQYADGAMWDYIIYHVAQTLEGAGFYGVVESIQIKNRFNEFDKEEPEYIPLSSVMEY